MLDRPRVSRDTYPHPVARVHELVEAGDDAGLAAELVDLAAVNGDVWRHDVPTELRALPAGRRGALILRVIERATTATPPVRAERLLVGLLDGIPADALSWRAGRYLVEAVSAWVAATPATLAVLAGAAERETGECPPALLAVIRRTAHEGDKRWPAGYRAPIQPWLDRAAGGLNAGEPWAEAANAAAPGPALLVHALAASGARPASRWTRRARALLPEVGGDETRALIRGWFALVPQPRTIVLRPLDDRWDPNEIPDAYNARALRGLLYLLAVTPPHDEDTAAVGRLVQYSAEKVPGHGPRSQMIAHAGIHALERFSTVPALRELARLRSTGQPLGIASALTAAIARRGVALGVDPARL
ncbi:hypothetical protein ACQP1P_28695 [Dactylosporangium sp. CA-052675]|uniref:hypothetical protein n=1 Tax=Dactylosporangium sp. CA-052675 TaxID=3239927 RepID=UPI003D8A5974